VPYIDQPPIICSPVKRKGMSWRLIDGRRCWYTGRRPPKARLKWKGKEKRRRDKREDRLLYTVWPVLTIWDRALGTIPMTPSQVILYRFNGEWEDKR
jgi:hypothetical protein